MLGQCRAQSGNDVNMQFLGHLVPCAPIVHECSGLSEQHTRVVNAVFPPPLGPTSKNVGSPVALATFL